MTGPRNRSLRGDWARRNTPKGSEQSGEALFSPPVAHYLRPMREAERSRQPRPDTMSLLAAGMMQALRTDLGELTRGFAQMSRTNTGFLDRLGATRNERVENIAAMLRNSTQADIDEMGHVVMLAMAQVAASRADDVGDRRATRRRPERSLPDPMSLVKGLRKIVSLDLDDFNRALEQYTRPSVRAFLEMMGKTRDEQVAKMAVMLQDTSPSDMEEMGTVFGLAMAKVSTEWASRSDDRRAPRRQSERPRRPRDLTSAEWRAQRRSS